MCCCCPPAISALFCLWVQSGFSKGSVAGALTFFPPEPPLYKFERRDKDGNVLPDDEDNDESSDSDYESDSDENEVELMETDGDWVQSGMAPNAEEPLERKPTKKGGKPKSASQQLTERAKKLRKRAQRREAMCRRDDKNGVTYVFMIDPRFSVPPTNGATVEALKLPSKGAHIATLIYRVPESHVTSKTKTLIYSHGNATDVGAMHVLQSILVHSLDANVVLYDYSGYGESSGIPMEKATYQDVATVYEHVLKHVTGDNPSSIVLYGQSVGSGPSCHLCTKVPDLGGLILHSPFTSGMRVLTPSRALACLDIYPNINRIKKVKCPVMVIHGRLDEEVDVGHGMAMHNAVPRHLQREPWWVPDRGHNDITEGPGKMAEYIRRLRRFLSSLDE